MQNHVTFYFIVGLMLLTNAAQSQENDFPQPIRPATPFTTPADVDTLFWLLKSTQYQKCLESAMALETTEAQLQEQATLVTRLEMKATAQDSTITDLQQGYDRYKNLWEETDKELEDTEVKLLKSRRRTFLAGILGIGAGLVIGAVAF